MPNLPAYVLITPARNEAQFIDLTLSSVVGQIVRPVRWVIVSDGSTDRTDDIVRKYSAEHDWIELVRLPERGQRNFAGKVSAFNAGYARLAGLQYDVIGNLDADVSFDGDYLAFLTSKFAENPRLGVAGTPYREENAIHDKRFKNPEHVSGACQLFRRECFEDIGGYPLIRSGGIDLVALLSAQAKGWQTRRFDEKFCLHHRNVGSALHAGIYRRLLNLGEKDYLLGSHPGFEIFRSAFQMKNKPYVVGGVLMLLGYAWAMLRRVERTMPEELIELRRSDQIQRLKNVLRHPLRHSRRPLLSVPKCLPKESAEPGVPSNPLGGEDEYSMGEVLHGLLMSDASAPTSSSVKSLDPDSVTSEAICSRGRRRRSGVLVINADDWGRDHDTTERTLECVLRGAVSSVSAMVFMEDSERAAAIARERGIEAGLHLNFTTPFSATGSATRIFEQQQRISRYLRRHRFAPVVFHPGLARSFEYVVTAQLDEFRRLYGAEPARIDGHHHMHLCANVLLGELLPAKTVVRRSFSFRPGEKSWCNRFYRRGVDHMLARRHRIPDFLFSLAPLDPPARLQGIFYLAHQSVVEVETHPINSDEYRFLAGGEIFRLTGDLPIAPHFVAAMPE